MGDTNIHQPIDDDSTRRRLLPSILVLALSAATVAVAVTGAVFTDSQSTSNSIATGTVTLSVTGNDPLPWSISAMAPGDVDGPVGVPVANGGSLELRYAITSTETTGTSPDLANQLDLWVWDESSESGNLLGLTDAAGVCEGTPSDSLTFLYQQGPLGTASSTINLVGDPTQGTHGGDRVLAAGADELLCFYLELPSATDGTYEGLTTGVDITFEAEQTSSNP